MTALEQERRRRGPLSAFVDEQTRRQLEQLARREDRSVSSIVRRALKRELVRAGSADDG